MHCFKSAGRVLLHNKSEVGEKMTQQAGFPRLANPNASVNYRYKLKPETIN